MPRQRDDWNVAPDLRSRVCECGMDIPAHGVVPSMLWVARHRVHHLDWLGDDGPAELANALRALVHALEADGKRLRDDLATRDDYIEELEADLVHERGRHVP